MFLLDVEHNNNLYMKKITLLLVFTSLLCTSCSKEENSERKLEYLTVRVTSDDSETPSGIVSLFYLCSGNSYDFNGYDLKEPPNVANGEMVYAVTNHDERIFPISKFGGDKLITSSNKDCSIGSFFWNSLSTIYGTPLINGKYVIFIKLSCGKYPRCYKVLTIDGNKMVNVHIPSASDYSECVTAEWQVSDYPQQ